MGFFQNVLASLGIGGLKIDARLHQTQVEIGGKITGEIHVFGGNVEQQIREFDLVLYTQAEKEGDNGRYYVTLPVSKGRIPASILVKPNEKHEIPFELHVPFHSPISFGQVQLWLGTEAEITNAVDAKDRDHVKVLPHPSQVIVLQAIEQMGFRLRKCDNEYKPYAATNFEQEFEFYPSGEFRSHLDELEIAFDLRTDQLIVKLTIDRKARGLGSLINEMAGTDDRLLRIAFDHDDIKREGSSFVEQQLRQIIHQYK